MLNTVCIYTCILWLYFDCDVCTLNFIWFRISIYLILFLETNLMLCMLWIFYLWTNWAVSICCSKDGVKEIWKFYWKVCDILTSFESQSENSDCDELKNILQTTFDCVYLNYKIWKDFSPKDLDRWWRTLTNQGLKIPTQIWMTMGSTPACIAH